jgi:hypothetical protein
MRRPLRPNRIYPATSGLDRSEAPRGGPNGGSNGRENVKGRLRAALIREASRLYLHKKVIIYQRPRRQNGPRADSDLGSANRIVVPQWISIRLIIERCLAQSRAPHTSTPASELSACSGPFSGNNRV